MDDLISRHAAIDALKRISFSYYFECGEYLSEDTREIEIINSNKALEAIKALPSAEESFEWCYTCKEYDQEKHCCHRWTKVIRNTVEELQSAQPEITAEQVKEFCEERGWVVLTKEEYQWLKSLKSKAEEYRWNGGGNY